MTPRQRRLLGLIVLVGFGLRLGWALYARTDAPFDWYLSGDQYGYYHYGQEIARGRGYIGYATGVPTAYYPIGYPAILGALYFVVLHTPIPDNLIFATSLFHVVISTASIALLFVVGRRLASVRVGLIAAGMLAVYPNMVFQVTTVQLETTFVFLLLVALAIILDHDWAAGPPSTRRLLAFGTAVGVAVLVRPFAAVLLIGLGGALAALSLGWRRVARGVAIPVAVVVALSIPWTIRNLDAMDSFVPSSTNMGDTLCLDRNLDATGAFRFSDHDGCVDPDLAEVPRNRGNTKKAIEFVIEHPDRELLQIVRRARYMFATDHDGIEVVQMLGAGPFLPERVVDVAEPVSDWYFYGILTLAIVGLPRLARRRRLPATRIVGSGLVGLLVIPLLLWGNPRFHNPLAPFLVLSGALALDAAWTRWRPSPAEPAAPDPAEPVAPSPAEA